MESSCCRRSSTSTIRWTDRAGTRSGSALCAGVADLCGHGFLSSQAAGYSRPRWTVSCGRWRALRWAILGRASGRIAAGGGTATERSRKTASIHRTASRLCSEIEPAGGWRRLLQNLQDPEGITTGRVDTRYRGPDLTGSRRKRSTIRRRAPSRRLIHGNQRLPAPRT